MEKRRIPVSDRTVIARRTALAHGIGPAALRRVGVHRPMTGLYALGESVTEWDMAAAWARNRPGVVVSSCTAAHYWGFRLPLPLQTETRIHLNRAPHAGRLRRKGVVSTQFAYLPQEVRETEPGVWVTSPVRTLYEVMFRLGDWALVAAADGLVNRHEQGYDTVDASMATLEELREYPRLRSGARGIRRFAQLMQRVKVGSDSVPETRLRLMCEDHGISDLVPGHAVHDEWGRLLFQSDLAHLASRTSIQYEGLHHADRDQMGRDIARGHRTREAGWEEVRLSGPDLRQQVFQGTGPTPRAVALVSAAIGRRHP